MDNALKPILVIGDQSLTKEVIFCLQQAGHEVTQTVHIETLNYSYELAIVVGNEVLGEKQEQIRMLEKQLNKTAIIAINTESIDLSVLQEHALSPDRIIGLNWASPAYTTFFLELITNQQTNPAYAETLYNLAKVNWNKDPYCIKSGLGIRSRMMAAMFREAAFLVENGFASVKDIDRACRNDAGYYLPFAGNFRYMDLMGTYAYGMVMKDLNPELSDCRELPDFFSRIIAEGGKGIANNKGFYTYTDEEKELLINQFKDFNVQIRDLIERYSNLNQPS